MNRWLLGAALCALLLVGTLVANAQSPTKLCIPTGVGNSCEVVGDGIVAGTTPLPVQSTAGGYPYGSTAITGNATGVSTSVVGTLSSASAKTAYICGFDVSAAGSDNAEAVTISGVIGNPLVYQYAVTISGSTVGRSFWPCIPASATALDITVTVGAAVSASAVNVNSWGYRQ